MISTEQRDEVLKRLAEGETDAAEIAVEVGVSKMQVAAVKAWRTMSLGPLKKEDANPTPESSTTANPSTPRAISIRQPYVEMILRGTKREEYRSHRTLIRGQVYLYAALTAGEDSDWRELGMRPGELPTGKVVGTVEIKDCHLDPSGECYAYVLENPKRLAEHLLPKNQPQPCFWRPQFQQ